MGGAATAHSEGFLTESGFRVAQGLGGELIEGKFPGYVLRVEQEQLDSGQFEALVIRAAAEGAEDRVRTLDEALGLWRGAPLLDVMYESFAQGEIRRLDELRIGTIEERCAARLELGAAAEVVPELQSLVHSYPYRERLRRQLMLALYRSGRAADALRTYVEWRVRLKKEWDAEPGAAIERTATDIRQQRRLELENVVPWRRSSLRSLSRRRRDTANDPLEMLAIDHAMAVFGAIERLEQGRSDGLEKLDQATVDAIAGGLLVHWTG